MELLTMMAIFIQYPWLAAVIGMLLVGLGRWRRRPTATIVGVIWVLYAAYETAMRLRWLCTGECNIRVDLLLIYPLLLAITVVGIVSLLRARTDRRTVGRVDGVMSPPARDDGGIFRLTALAARSGETSMSIVQTLLPEFDHEMANTRRLLEIVPAADAAWRPHPKSYSLGDLAAHIMTLPLWGRFVLQQPELDLGSPANASIAQMPFTTVAELLDQFDRHVREARTALASLSDAAMGATWTLKNRGATVFAMPRAGVLRSFILSHMIHHRGQLSVYLRLRDVPLPSLYGPTADTRG